MSSLSHSCYTPISPRSYETKDTNSILSHEYDTTPVLEALANKKFKTIVQKSDLFFLAFLNILEIKIEAIETKRDGNKLTVLTSKACIEHLDAMIDSMRAVFLKAIKENDPNIGLDPVPSGEKPTLATTVVQPHLLLFFKSLDVETVEGKPNNFIFNWIKA